MGLSSKTAHNIAKKRPAINPDVARRNNTSRLGDGAALEAAGKKRPGAPNGCARQYSKDCYLERQGVSGQVVKHPELLSGDQPPCGTFTTQ
jgi:hypothetical protein